MREHDNVIVCLNGHIVNPRVNACPDQTVRFCQECGKAAIGACPECKAPFKWSSFERDGLIISRGGHEATLAELEQRGLLKWWQTPREPHKFCERCGKPFPWTEKAMAAAKDGIKDLEGLDQQEKGQLRDALPDLVCQSPKTSRAASLFRRLLLKTADHGAPFLTQCLANIACALAKKELGL